MDSDMSHDDILTSIKTYKNCIVAERITKLLVFNMDTLVNSSVGSVSILFSHETAFFSEVPQNGWFIRENPCINVM